MGHGAQKTNVRNLALEMKLPNVRFHDSVSKDRMPDVWSVCNVALVHLKNDPVFSTVIPSKIFEAFGMGKPVLIVQPKGEAAELIELAGAGRWVPPEDPAALAGAVLDWSKDSSPVDEFAHRSETAAAEHSRDRLAAEMLSILKTLANKSQNRP